MKLWWLAGGILLILIIISAYVLWRHQPVFFQTPKLPVTIPQLSIPALQPEKHEVTLLAVGDIMLSRNVAATIKKQNDWNYPFESLQSFISSADIAFANLESPITVGPEVKTGSFTFHADPGIEKSISWAGFDILSLANNHLPNYGEQGIKDTIKLLDSVNIKHAGAGLDATEALQPAIITVKGKKFGFLAFNDSDVVPPSYGAGSNNAGTNLMDEAKLKQAILALRPQVDFIIVSMHSGIEYTATPNKHQQDFAHAAIDDGADVVIGHHPHVVQSIERYHDKYIFYSLGNFVFDQMFSEETRQGLAVRLTFDDRGVQQVGLFPVLIENYSQPHFLDPNLAQDIHRRFGLAVTTTTSTGIAGWVIDN